jgi:hypothetical protein
MPARTRAPRTRAVLRHALGAPGVVPLRLAGLTRLTSPARWRRPVGAGTGTRPYTFFSLRVAPLSPMTQINA